MAVDIENLPATDPPMDAVRSSRAAISEAREQMIAARSRVKSATAALIDTSLETARSGRAVSSDKLRAVRPPEAKAAEPAPESDLTARFKALREPV